jgi:ABC-type phosphate transport system substrate-binding protein
MRWRPLPAFAAIDFLSCLVVVFVAVALTSRPPQVKTYGAYAVVMTWPKGDNDVDLFVRNPDGAISYFGKAQVDQMQLEHDDLGTAMTGYAHTNENQERTVLRSATPGEWTANVFLYTRSEGTSSIPVAVTLWDLRSEDRIVYRATRRLTRNGDERTAFRFTIGPGGNVAGTSQLPLSLVSATTAYASG